MKLAYPTQTLSDQLWQLYEMETHIATALPVLSGSVMNTPLRKWLSRRAMAARDRRNTLEELLKRHAHPLATKTHSCIRGILAEGNRELSRIHHPYSRDVATIEHCIRIEQHATTAYGIAIPLARRIGFPPVSDKLSLLLNDLETARFSFHVLEAEIFSIAASNPPHGENPRSTPSISSRNTTCHEAPERLDLAC